MFPYLLHLCYGLNVSPPDSYVETLTRKGMVPGGVAFGG